jgi:hypothetical protein
MDDNERYTGPTGWEAEELPGPRSVVRVQKEQVSMCWVIQGPGIKNRITLVASTPPRSVTSLAISVAAVTLIGGAMATTLWGLGMATWAALAVGATPCLMFCALYLAERRGTVRAADSQAVLGRRLPRDGGAHRE